MPASHYVDNEAKLIITTWVGDAVDNDLIEALKKYQMRFLNKPYYYTYDEVVNFTRVSRINVSVKGLINISKIAARTDKDRIMTKVAFIVSSDLAFNFAKLYATYRNFGKNIKKQICIFKTESEALEWIREG